MGVHQLFIGFKKTYYSMRREVLYNILIEFRVPMKFVTADYNVSMINKAK
jgi:hypothetical protein